MRKLILCFSLFLVVFSSPALAGVCSNNTITGRLLNNSGDKKWCCDTSGCDSGYRVSNNQWVPLAFPAVIQCKTKTLCNQFENRKNAWCGGATTGPASCPGNATCTPGTNRDCWNWACKSGYTKSGNSCVQVCTAGQYLSGTSCLACAAGKFSASAGATSCSTCPAGQFSLSGASSCTKCSAGRYSAAGATSCTICPEGKWAAEGASSCTSCPDDKPNAPAGSTSESACTAPAADPTPAPEPEPEPVPEPPPAPTTKNCSPIAITNGKKIPKAFTVDAGADCEYDIQCDTGYAESFAMECEKVPSAADCTRYQTWNGSACIDKARIPISEMQVAPWGHCFKLLDNTELRACLGVLVEKFR